MTEILIELGQGCRVRAYHAGHIIETDQTIQDGGDNSAPSPFDLFLASLGTCTGYYALAFCRERGLSPEGIRLVQRIERDEAAGMIVRIAIEIQLPPTFPDKYRAAIVRVAEQCAVKKHLVHPPAVEIGATVVAPA